MDRRVAEFETMGGSVRNYVTAIEDMGSRDGCSVEVLDWAADHDDKQLIREMIDWLHDCDVDVSGDETGTIADSDVRQMIENGYEGGVKAFMADGLETFEYARIRVIGPRITVRRWESFGFRLLWTPSLDLELTEILEYGASKRPRNCYEAHCCFCELAPEACPKHTAEVKP